MARVTEMMDDAYASYGWWLHKSADGDYTASAFRDFKGTAPDAVTIADLNGTAIYRGGAAGKYVYSSTGGTNDAGHFTARVTLEATFGAEHEVEGTIDGFVGADGQSRNWSVELKKSGISDAGAMQAADGQTVSETNPLMTTVWTIDGTDAAAAGEWSGMLQDEDEGGVPKVATGTFTSEYSTAGNMVGAFGAKME